jgi:hypothetical protein
MGEFQGVAYFGVGVLPLDGAACGSVGDPKETSGGVNSPAGFCAGLASLAPGGGFPSSFPQPVDNPAATINANKL